MKVPQILLITNARSARGLSFNAYILETLSYAITLFYAFRNEFPFSTYGENLFLTLQNIIITVLISAYSAHPNVLPTLVGAVGIVAGLFILPMHVLALLQLATVPLSILSKLPQIRQNARAQSTGQLSAFAVGSQVLGCLARVFTTAVETSDPLLAGGFIIALLLNIVLGVQMYTYWGKDEEEPARKEKHEEAVWEKDTKARFETPHRIATPPPRTPSSAGSAKKWARKVD